MARPQHRVCLRFDRLEDRLAPAANWEPAALDAPESYTSCQVTASEATLRTSKARTDGAVLLYKPLAPRSAQNPAFSPDSETVLFTVFRHGYNNGPAGMYFIPLFGGTRTKLFKAPDHDSVNLPGTSWNAATNRIVFSSDLEDTHEIWTINPDGTGLFRVTNHADLNLFFAEPSFSPDGQFIVFHVTPPDTPDDTQQGSIWLVRADGTGLTQLTGGPGSGFDDRQPNWSPAGDRILFQRRIPGGENWDLFTMNSDGTGIQQVTTNLGSDTDASWSPDGQWIVYSTDHGGLDVPNIFVIPAAGGDPIRVTTTAVHEDAAPSWSPDGQWIVFESHRAAEVETPARIRRIQAPDVLGVAAAGLFTRSAREERLPQQSVPAFQNLADYWVEISISQQLGRDWSEEQEARGP